MLNTTRLYDLSFVFPDRAKGRKAQIVFSIHESHFEELCERLSVILVNLAPEVERYFGEKRGFSSVIPGRRFGFGRCGRVSRTESSIELALSLSQASLRDVTCTIHLLGYALGVPMEKSSFRSNKSQQMEISTVCRGNDFNGHAIHGYVSREVVAWIKTNATSKGDMFDRHEAPREILDAMKVAHRAVTEREEHTYARYVRGYFTREGRFSLECDGNACDVGIIPNDLWDGASSVLSCHNLDYDSQQVTLIAGLAKLCELARKDE